MVRTDVDRINPRTNMCELLPHLLMDLLQSLPAEPTTRNGGLIGDHHDEESGLVQPSDRFPSPWQQVKILWPTAVGPVAGDGAVPIQENCPTPRRLVHQRLPCNARRLLTRDKSPLDSIRVDRGDLVLAPSLHVALNRISHHRVPIQPRLEAIQEPREIRTHALGGTPISKWVELIQHGRPVAKAWYPTRALPVFKTSLPQAIPVRKDHLPTELLAQRT